jgi:ferritin
LVSTSPRGGRVVARAKGKNMITVAKSAELTKKFGGSEKNTGSVEVQVAILTERIKDEYYAHGLYRAAANWCHDQNYKKASVFFDADAKTELDHAEIIQKYMTDFNIIPFVEGNKEKFEFSNLIDIIYKAYEFELYLMKQYNKNSQEVFSEDLITFDFLEQFRNIQRESVVEFNDLINASNLVDKSDKFQVLYFEQTYF